MVNGLKGIFQFRLGEAPNDMKMLCFLDRELANTANYFTTSAKVNKGNLDTLPTIEICGNMEQCNS